MNAPSRIAIAIAAIIALSACSEAEMPPPAAEPPTPMVSDTPTAETDLGSPPPVSEPAVEADPDSPPPTEVSVEINGICNIESIGDVSGPEVDVPVQVESDIVISGWRTYQAADGTEAPAWLRVLGQDGSIAFQAALPATEERPDVAEAVNRESALQSGFRQMQITGLPQGSYTIEVLLNGGAEWVRCLRTWQIQVM